MAGHEEHLQAGLATRARLMQAGTKAVARPWVLLLVEDDDGDRRLFELAVRSGGLRVDVVPAPTLADAMAHVAELPVDVVVLDLGLPDAQGLSGLETMQRAAPGVPVIVLTGQEGDSDLGVRALQAGAQDLLNKSDTRPQELVRAIRFAIERERLTRQVTRQARERAALARVDAAGRSIPDLTELARDVAVAVQEAMEGTAVVQVHLEDGASRATIPDQLDVPPTAEPTTWPLGSASTAGWLRVWPLADAALLDGQHAFLQRVGERVSAWLAQRDAVVRQKAVAERHAQLIATVPVGVTYVDADGQIVVANAEARHIFGAGPDELLGHAFDDLVVRTGDADGGPLTEEASPFSRVAATRSPVWDAVHAIVRPDESRVVVSVNASPLFGPDGAFTGMVAAINDVTAQRAAVRELSDSRASLQLVMGQLPAVLWTVDRDLRFTSIGGAALGSLVEPPAPGDDFADYFASGPDFLPVAAHRAALRGQPRRYTFWWDDHHWQVAVEPLVDPALGIIGAVGIGLDTTRERRALEQVDAERARYQALIDTTRDAIVLTDDHGRFLQVNPAACTLLGRASDELLGRTAESLITRPELQQDIADLRARLLTRGELTGSLLIPRPDGTTVETEYQAVAGIQPGVHFLILRDVTERQTFERALAASEEQYRTLAENAIEGIFRIRLRPDRAYEYVNPAFERITGFAAEDVMADPALMRERTHPDDRLDDLEAGPSIVEFTRADGVKRWLEVRQTPVHDVRHVAAVQGLILDVTDQQRHVDALTSALAREERASDELRHIDELKSSFLQATSHELRTPLAVVYGFALTLRDHAEHLDAAQRDTLVSRLVDNAERLRQLLDDLLDVDRLSHGDIAPQREPLDLATLAERVARTVPVGHRTVNLKLAPAPTDGEVRMLERVVHNLIVNAVKHTPEGTTVWVSTGMADEGWAHLAVADDGPGIPDGLKEQVLQPFVQGPASSRSPQPGTGIGLALVRQFTALHGGTVEITDRPGGGACVTARLPGRDASTVA